MMNEDLMKIKNKCVITLFCMGSLFCTQHIFANTQSNAVNVAEKVTIAVQQNPEQKIDAEKLSELLLSVDIEKMNALGELDAETDADQENKIRTEALTNIRDVNEKAKKLTMQSSVGKDALTKFIAFNEYNIQYLQSDEMFNGTAAQADQISDKIATLNEDLMQSLSALLEK